MIKNKMPFSKELILLNDVETTVENIISCMKKDVIHRLKRFGVVVGISGGIDSSVCFALAIKAFGPKKVIGLTLPEKDSSPDSENLAHNLAKKYGATAIKEDITDILSGFGCYKKRDEAVGRIFPEYNPGSHKMKISILGDNINTNLPPVYTLTIIDESGEKKSRRLPAQEYLQIVAASNFKQRSRMSMLYYYAEANHFAVIGTPNKHEQEQGFFVKHGDGAADLMPIKNLYKTQVYQIGRYLDIPEEIMNRTPTTDTYSAEQTQEEFFYQLPYDELDYYWYGYENGYSPDEIAKVLGVSSEKVEMIFKNFDRKRRTTEYLRLPPLDNY